MPRVIDTLKRAIDKQDLTWSPEENDISRLSYWQQRRRMGVIMPSDEEIRGMEELMPKARPPKIPNSWDWRDAYGHNYVSPVKDQGGCGSCWAFGSIAQLESAMMIKDSIARSPDMSEQYMVSCSTENFGCRGGYMYPTYDFLRDNGVPDEPCFPYTAKDLECSQACENPKLIKIKSWERVPYQPEYLKAAVYKQPITVTMWVYRDFLYYRSGIYKYAYGDLLGGHAVCVVGYSQKQRHFIAKNSWGPRWGENGYFRIAESEMGYNAKVRFGLQAGRFIL